MPPPLPPVSPTKIITISGKKIPPPPRKVIIERLGMIHNLAFLNLSLRVINIFKKTLLVSALNA